MESIYNETSRIHKEQYPCQVNFYYFKDISYVDDDGTMILDSYSLIWFSFSPNVDIEMDTLSTSKSELSKTVGPVGKAGSE